MPPRYFTFYAAAFTLYFSLLLRCYYATYCIALLVPLRYYADYAAATLTASTPLHACRATIRYMLRDALILYTPSAEYLS